ncbi:MAG: NAD(P)H-dependent oxidoreductase subunit E, partial [Hyphomicrobiales bacterium]
MNIQNPPRIGGNGAEPRRKPRRTPKGRQIDPAAADEVSALLGDRSRQRDLLIEHLHLIQDKYGCISSAHLTALAAEMKLSQTEVYEVATFYAHFDVVKEGQTPPPPVTVRVCDSLSCAMAGADRLLNDLPGMLGAGVRVVRAPCMGACDHAPVCAVGHVQVNKATDAAVKHLAHPHTHAHPIQPGTDFEHYMAAGGYRVLAEALTGKRTRDELIKTVSDSGLRGLGGAGFPTGRKWALVLAEKGPRLMAVNGDEGEPGTFKDRHYLGLDPHRFIEGMLIAAWVVEAAEVYFYLRDEYPELRLMLEDEIEKVRRAGLDRFTKLHMRRGAGAYICGEETALLDSLEGYRGQPRLRPPFPAVAGLYASPTVINNVESIASVPPIVDRGVDWFKTMGREKSPGFTLYSLSGHVTRPGQYEAPLGVTLRELLDLAGGVREGHELKFWTPGGSSTPILTAEHLDSPL